MPIVLATWEDHNPRPAQANRSRDRHLQNNQSKVDWRCGPSGRALSSNPSPTKKKIKGGLSLQVINMTDGQNEEACTEIRTYGPLD
jgi:hypothetical protein